jgi:probable DNA metabolism protein
MRNQQRCYVYDGTLEGLLTAVFLAFENKDCPEEILAESRLEQNLFSSYHSISTDVEKAERVMNGIIEHLGTRTYNDVKRAFLSDDERKGGIVLRYLQYTLKHKEYSRLHLAHPAVADFEELLRIVNNEAHYMIQFVRFAQLENGMFFSRIKPKASIVPLIMDHFAARFNIQSFIIFDVSHALSGVFDKEEWWLVEASDVAQLPNSTIEDEFQALWQTFFDTIAIEERKNPVCQRNFMPKRFWGNMCELTPPELRKHRPKSETPTKDAKLGRLPQTSDVSLALNEGLLTSSSSHPHQNVLKL